MELPRISRSRLTRYGLVGAGVCSVGMGAVGVVVPGLPTTVFLIIAAWCFARSCPWLTERLICNRFFGPFVRYLEPGVVMPRRAKVISLCMMWAAIAGSCWLMIAREAPDFVPVLVVLTGVAGSWYIARQGLGRAGDSRESDRVVRHPVGRHEREHKNPACTTTTGASLKTH